MSDLSYLQPHIYTILSAPDVDLASISAKRVRRQLVEDGHTSADFVKDNKSDIDLLIAEVFQRVSAERDFTPGDEEGEEGVEGEDEDGDAVKHDAGGKRRRATADEGGRRRKRAAVTDGDEAYAKRLQAELNPPTRASRSGSRGATGGKANGAGTKRGRKTKSAETVDGTDEDEDMPKKKRRAGGGFLKPYQLSEPLGAVLNATVLPRGQVVKGLWDYIKGNNLQNPSDKREIICDDKLRAVFKLDKVTMFSMNKELSKHLIDPANA